MQVTYNNLARLFCYMYRGLYHSYIVYHRCLPIACSPWELVGGAGPVVHGEQSGIQVALITVILHIIRFL